MSGVYTGVAQGVLRLSATDSDSSKLDYLKKAFKRMREGYPNEPLYVTLTANVILRSTTSSSFSLFFGQSFGSARTVYFGQEHDEDTGHLSRLFTEFKVDELSDLAALPIRFTTEDFAALYKRNFAKSDVVVHRVVSLVYFFSLGLENYENDHTQERGPVRFF